MQQLAVLRRYIQHPFMPVLGVLISAGAAKSGHGVWAASMILVSVSTYAGVLATAMLTRSLGAWVDRMQPDGKAGFSVAELSFVMPGFRVGQHSRHEPSHGKC